MAVVRRTDPGGWRAGAQTCLSFAGAEATVAIGLCRLGHTARWIGRLGADDLGDMIHDALRGEGVDVDLVVRDAEAPTGLLVRHRRTADHTTVTYYRDGLAGARLAPADIPASALTAARILHLSGITPALGAGPATAVDSAVGYARAAGVAISLDLNYRSRLWPPHVARPVLARLVSMADLVFASPDEAVVAAGERADGTDARSCASALLALGAREVVIKLGAAGAVSVTAEGVRTVPAVPVTAVDPVGAGDAFVAGYLSGMLDGAAPQARLKRAAVCGAFAASTNGDWEGLPRRRELGLLTGGTDVAR